ncbi:MAG TPA: O-antigen ligase family protein [Miltoncostaeaceae bacterium]|nr:O-antigen ligase family protein [Miltoncostaeaceae bacterium]
MPRTALWIGAVAVAGWAAVTCADGGMDFGDGLGGAGATSAFLALAVGAPLAAALLAWGGPALRAWPTRLALAAMAGLGVWSAASIAWADAPDLAWIDVNRVFIGLCALAIGVGLGAVLRDAPRLFALALAAGAAPAVLYALGTKVLPGVMGDDADLARLSAPLGYWNALALVAVFAVPGLLWLAGGAARPRWGPPVAGAGMALVVTTVLLTYSRGGLLSLLMALGVTIAFLPGRRDGVAAAVAGGVGAILPSAYALTEPLLSTDQVPTALREGAGGQLGWRLAVGVAIGALLAPALARLAIRIGPARGRRIGVVALAVAAVAVVGTFAASGEARSWAGDRVSEFRGAGGDAVANEPGRLVNASGNQRKGWWEEAWRAWTDAPVAGQGAGGFALVHLQERTNGDDSLNTREPHDIVLRTLSGTGVVGLALLLALVVAVGWGALRVADRDPGPSIGLPLAIVAAFALQAAVDWSWAIPALTIPALAAAGIVLAAAASGPPGRTRVRPSPVAAGVLAAAAAVLVVSAVLPWWSSRDVREGRQALADGRPGDAVALAKDARATNPLAITPLILMAQAYTDQGDLPRALGAYRAATRVQPDNPQSWRALAIFLGPDRQAAAAWRRVHRLDPQDPEAAIRGG